MSNVYRIITVFVAIVDEFERVRFVV